MKHKYNMLGSLMGEEEDGNDQVSHINENEIFLKPEFSKVIDLFVNAPKCI